MATGIGTVNLDLAPVVPEHGHSYLMGNWGVLDQVRPRRYANDTARLRTPPQCHDRPKVLTADAQRRARADRLVRGAAINRLRGSTQPRPVYILDSLMMIFIAAGRIRDRTRRRGCPARDLVPPIDS